ncbi:hypothetical protein ACI65C_013730 [Semiaphis heraclei]
MGVGFIIIRQLVRKNVVKLGFLHLVNTNDIALKIIRMLMSIPLLPAISMRLGFDELCLYSRRNNVNFESLFSYYERFWLDRMGTQFVSVYNCPRRTNNVESFHNKLRLKFCSAHPSPWIFIGVLEVENIDNAEDNQLIQENINARDIENNFPVLYQNRVLEVENIGNAEDNQLPQQNPHFEHTENDNGEIMVGDVENEISITSGDEVDYLTPEDRDPDMQYMMNLDARRRQLELEKIPYVRVPAILPSLINVDEMCIVCKDAEKTYALIPCGHKVVCEECLNLLDPKRCPLCNLNFINSLRVW